MLGRFVGSAVCVLVLATGCTVDPTHIVGPSDGFEGGKADNYRSPIGQEYRVESRVIIRLEGQDSGLFGEERDARVHELVNARVDEITQKLDAWMWQVLPQDRRTDISIVLRVATPRGTQAIEADEHAYAFDYSVEAAGPNDLLDRLPLVDIGGTNGVTLTLDDQSQVDLFFTGIDSSPDSYPRFLDLFEDGLDIGILVGGDYNMPRYDLPEAQALYDEMLALGLGSPVEGFPELRLDSGSFYGTISVAGQDTDVRVQLVHADMGTPNEIRQAYIDMARTMDVVIFRGHASRGTFTGSSAGVWISFNPSVSIAPSEFRNLDLPNKHQIFVFDGCHTYSEFADDIYAHPNKDETNTDIVTSVSYGSGLSEAEATVAFLRGLLAKRNDEWLPRSWDNILVPVNRATVGNWTPIYGVHGTDENPSLSPFANPDVQNLACESDADCGAIDTLCIENDNGEGKRCTVACATAALDCPNLAACTAIQHAEHGVEWLCL